MINPHASLSSSSSRRRAALAWAVSLGVVALYGAFMVRQIVAHTAVPYFDQATYVMKAQNLAALIEADRSALVDPRALLATNPTARGPLMPLIAVATVGADADPRWIAVVWLAVRLVVLCAALAMLHRVSGRPEALPAIAMLVLGSVSQLTLNPSLYMMDQTFESVGLLVFALALNDLAGRSVPSAAALGLATLVLVLVKPAGVVFAAPLYAVIAGEAILRRRWRWALTHVIIGVLLGLLAVSPYGIGVAHHYAVARADYWWGLFTGPELVQWTVRVLPPWLVALALVSLVTRGRGGLPYRLLPCATLTVGVWLVFNAVLTRVIDPRLLVAPLPIVVSAAALVIFRTRSRAEVEFPRTSRRISQPPGTSYAILEDGGRIPTDSTHDLRGAKTEVGPLGWALTLGAAVVFVIAIASAAGRTALPPFVHYVHGLPARQQPVPEVGLHALARRVAEEVDTAEPGSAPVSILPLVNDDFVDSAAVGLVLRAAHGAAGARLQPVELLFGSNPATLDDGLEARWFVTKARRKAIVLAGDAWTVMLALDSLITDPASPMHDHFEKRFAHTVYQPDLEDEISVWRLTRRPVAATYLRALQWLEPRFRDTRGHAALLERIGGLEQTLAALAPAEYGTVEFYIDRLERAAGDTRIDGWAFAPDLPDAGHRVLLTLQGPEEALVFHTRLVPRPDVSRHFARTDLDDSGFSIVLPHGGLPSGRLRVGLVVSGGERPARREIPHDVVVP